LSLPARVGVAAEVQLRSSDNSIWRSDAFFGFALSILESHGWLVWACSQSWGRLFHSLLVSLIPLSCFLVVSFCCNYPALMRSVPSSFWFAVCCHLILLCLRHSLLFSVCSHLKAADARVECVCLSSCMHVLPVVWASELEPTALGAPAARPILTTGPLRCEVAGRE
jgi:hypothetical protein